MSGVNQASVQLRSIDDLPKFEDIVGSDSHLPSAQDFTHLFAATSERLLNGGEKRVVVFRSADLRKLAAHPAMSNNVPAPFNLHSEGEPQDQAANAPPPSASEARDIELGRPMRRFAAHHLFSIDYPPVYTPLRQLYARSFMAKQVARWSPLAETIVVEIIQEVAGKGEVDFSVAFTEQLPVRLWAALFDMTQDEQDRVVRQVRAMHNLFLLTPSEEDLIALYSGCAEYIEMLADVIGRVRRGDSEASAWVNELATAFDLLEIEGKPADFNVLLAINLFDAFHTGAIAAANVVYALLDNPQALAAVQANPDLVSNAVTEGLRLLSPAPWTERFAGEDFEFDGVLIPKGTTIAMIWAAGNRDPDVFADPNAFDIHRKQTAEHAFGGGGRICPGRYFGRVLIEALVKRLTAPGVRIELTGQDYRLVDGVAARQVGAMPVTVSLGR